jgi:hypothetical protein
VVTAVPALAVSPRNLDEEAALELLVDAASAGRTLSYAGTQYVATWGPAASTTTLVELEHAPGRGAVVRHTGEADAPEPVLLSSAPMNETLVEVLRDRYQLRVVGEGTCTGRTAQVVEASRPGATGAAAVAGRFWVDRETGLLLRREVFDADGRRLRSSAFLDLAVAPQTTARPAVRAARPERGEVVRAGDLRRLREAGWHVPDALPAGSPASTRACTTTAASRCCTRPTATACPPHRCSASRASSAAPAGGLPAPDRGRLAGLGLERRPAARRLGRGRAGVDAGVRCVCRGRARRRHRPAARRARGRGVRLAGEAVARGQPDGRGAQPLLVTPVPPPT